MLRRRQGFTLLEMSIVLVIIAVVVAGGAVTFAISLQQRQYDETYAKMAVIQKALLDFRRTFNRLPCPGNILHYDPNDRYFGREAGTHSSCTGTPAASYSVTSGTTTVVGGLVPTKTLGLVDEYAFDGWGRRFLYAVDTDFTQDNAFLIESDVSGDVNNGTQRINILNVQDETITSAGVYVLLSYGANGHGAYGRYTTSGYVSAELKEELIRDAGSYQIASRQAASPVLPGQEVATDWANDTVVVPPSYVLALMAPALGGGTSGGEIGTGTTATPTPRTSSGSANAWELENCDCDGDAANGTFDYTFYQAPITNTSSDANDDFDDILIFVTRGDLAAANE